MPSDQPAVSMLIQEVLSDPDPAHDDVFRRLLRAGLQDMIDAEATAVIGAGHYERTSGRTNRRNGKRPKALATTAGEVDLTIPKLRRGSRASPPAKSMTWSRPWATSPGSAARRSHGSARTSTRA